MKLFNMIKEAALYLACMDNEEDRQGLKDDISAEGMTQVVVSAFVISACILGGAILFIYASAGG